MFVYIVRRLFAAVFLLLVVSAITFAIFFLLPRLAGGTADSLATQYVGKNPSPESIAAVKKNLGFDQPLYAQYWDFLRGIFAGREFNYGPDPRSAAPPASATPSRTTSRSGPTSSTGCPSPPPSPWERPSSG